MSKITLVTGGSRSGKSSFAESLFEGRDDVLYIATAIVTDKEMENRIKRHREDRNSNWETYEGHKNLNKAIEGTDKKYVLLDCVTVMMTNLLFDKERDYDNMQKDALDSIMDEMKHEFKLLIDSCRENDKELVMVTNEVGSGIVPEYKISRVFRDIAGWINQYIAKLSDEVYIVACGLPLKLK
ncbi:bifunctional adenosylcobinamide kinase/adenosylcobinamide-phosphate guanylyltransferase [Oceanirhabdus sp. W0125-5]|uniref:bifunctional adenosylcobinamide kinase/adenosylcobinamide-phosphate guanylyltransferase n=1 Tax=Oceanirhabdus sp. W0125-5 TaxID=2999116 RepID=UPI0022F2FC99|nr:bifunctional adenosylcobinamide kinase/adenosylcobinamide-phosphate guanylyltransferase [Oceanirhabdus sp. W0125-5]WBW98937.1 bifunctional adenosylcobinamide kinase/adenosylcobinamide-phosphate guanylyltransferase [Oceanirhabdus sp. W0125-5]